MNTKEVDSALALPRGDSSPFDVKYIDLKQIKDLDHIRKQLKILTTLPKIGSIWKHYKGDEYEVKGIILNEKDQEIFVSYSSVSKDKRLDDNNIIHWARNLEEWNGNVNLHIDGNSLTLVVKRYTFVK